MQNATISLGVDRISSILTYAGTDALLAYLSVETFKHFEDKYCNFNLLGNFSLIKSEKVWLESMDKLVEMKLATACGNYYITRTTLNDWQEFAKKNTPKSLQFNGFIVFNMTELYKNSDTKTRLKDLIYLTIRENVVKDRNYSREFVKDLTGFDKEAQKRIEERNSDIVEVIGDQFKPISKFDKVDDKKPIFPGHFVPSQLKCIRVSNKNSSCRVIQSGNKVKIKPLNLSYFKVGKRFNDSCKRDEVKSMKGNNESCNRGKVVSRKIVPKNSLQWNDFDMVIDSSRDFENYSDQKLVHKNDRRKSSWKNFKTMNYSKIMVLDQNGSLKTLGESINHR